MMRETSKSTSTSCSLSLSLSLFTHPFLSFPSNVKKTTTTTLSQLQPRRDRSHRERRLRPRRGLQVPRRSHQGHLPRRLFQGLFRRGRESYQRRRRPSENLLCLVFYGQPGVGDGLQGAIRDHVRRLQVQRPDEDPQGLVQVAVAAVRERRLEGVFLPLLAKNQTKLKRIENSFFTALCLCVFVSFFPPSPIQKIA